MNPEMPAPQFNPERTPVDNGRNLEYGSASPSPERTGEKSREQEQAIQPGEREPTPAPPPVLPVPAPAPQVVPMPTVTPVTSSNPPVAADDDLIEKEWVDKAKRIIAETRDDPYKREQEISKLQADYLRKRYGREIGVST